MKFIIVFLNIVLELMQFAVFMRIILSWIRISPGKFSYMLYDITDPVLNMAKRIPHRIGMFDLSPLIALIGLDIIRYFLLGFM